MTKSEIENFETYINKTNCIWCVDCEEKIKYDDLYHEHDDYGEVCQECYDELRSEYE